MIIFRQSTPVLSRLEIDRSVGAEFVRAASRFCLDLRWSSRRKTPSVEGVDRTYRCARRERRTAASAVSIRRIIRRRTHLSLWHIARITFCAPSDAPFAPGHRPAAFVFYFYLRLTPQSGFSARSPRNRDRPVPRRRRGSSGHESRRRGGGPSTGFDTRGRRALCETVRNNDRRVPYATRL